MKNGDLSRMLSKKNETYFKIRTKASELSQKLGRRVTIQEFLVKASERLLMEKNLESLFKEAEPDGEKKSESQTSESETG